MKRLRLTVTLGVLGAAGCHLVGDVTDVTFVDELRCLGATDCAAGECRIPTCQDGRCGVVNVVAGETCGGGFCNGQGLCRACQVDARCSSGTCQDEQCVAETCATGKQDGDETGIDCGGACAPCVSGDGCNDAVDCAGGICVDGACEPCTATASCPAETYCDARAGECAPQKPIGGACEVDAECLAPYTCDGDDDECEVDD